MMLKDWKLYTVWLVVTYALRIEALLALIHTICMAINPGFCLATFVQKPSMSCMVMDY